MGEAFGFHILEVPGGEFLRSLGFIGILNAADFQKRQYSVFLLFNQYRYYTSSQCFCICNI